MRVIVTRPEPAARRTANRLEADGHEAILLPLFDARYDIPDLTLAASRPFDAFDAIAATSAEVFRALSSSGPLTPELLSMPVFAVGEATAAAAKEAGFTRIVTGPGDGAGLADRIGGGPLSRKLLYLAGHPRSPAFEAGLTAAGVAFTAVECYRMEPVGYAPEQFRKALVSARAGAVLLYSRETAARFFALVAESGSEAMVAPLRIACLSTQVASAVPTGWSAQVAIAAAPHEDALFERLYACRSE